MPRNKYKVPMIILGGIALRFLFLSSAPTGLHFDEARNGLDAEKIANGEYKNILLQPILFGSEEGSREALYANILSFAVRHFPQSVIALRASSALISSISLILFYFLAKKYFKKERRKIFISVVFFSASSWILITSRLVFRVNLVPLFVILSSYFLLDIFEVKRLRSYLFFGFFNALGLYTYNSYPLIFIFLYFVLLLKGKVSYTLTAIIVSAVVLLPVATFFQKGSNFNKYVKRANELSIFNPIWTHNSQKEIFKAVGKNTLLNSQMFVGLGDKNRRHNAFRLPALDFPLNIILLIFIVSKRRKIKRFFHLEKKMLFAVAGVFISLIPAIITFSGSPHFIRSYTASVFIALLIPDVLLATVKTNRVLKAILTVFIFSSLFKVFYLWRQKTDFTEVFGFSQYGIAKDIIQTKTASSIYVFDQKYKNMTIDFLIPKTTPVTYLDRINFIDNSDKDNSTYYIPADSYNEKGITETINDSKCIKEERETFTKLVCSN